MVHRRGNRNRLKQNKKKPNNFCGKQCSDSLKVLQGQSKNHLCIRHFMQNILLEKQKCYSIKNLIKKINK